MYSWKDIALRTEIVYATTMTLPENTLFDRFAKYYTNGSWSGKLAVMMLAFNYFLLNVLEWLQPKDTIELCWEKTEKED